MCLKKMQECLAPYKHFSEQHLWPLALLALRLKVASVFLVDGGEKFGYVLHDELATLYALFESYKIPLLPSHVATWMGMSGEIIFGLLLAVGLFGRIGALGLIFISAVIFHTDGNPQAVYWALICTAVATYGPGKWSVDNWMWCIFSKRNPT